MNRLAPRTMRGLSLVMVGWSALVMIALGTTTLVIVHREIEAQIDHRLELEMEGLLGFERDHGFEALAGRIDARDASTPSKIGYLAHGDQSLRRMRYMLVDAEGARRAGAGLAVPPLGWTEFLAIDRPDGTTGWAQTLNHRLPGGGQLVIAADRSALSAMDHNILWMFLGALVAILICGLLVMKTFNRIIRRRLSAISMTAESIALGDFSRRVASDGSDPEFDRLTNILNAMFVRVEGLMQNLRQVSADIAHDLRTPLGRVRARLEQLGREEVSPERRERLGTAIDDIDDMLALFTGLLSISEIEGLRARDRLQRVAIDDLVEEVVQAYQPVFEDAEIGLEARTRRIECRADPQLIKQALSNLLDNVLAHTGPGTRTCVALSWDDGHALISVADDGPGIRDGSEDLIFQRLTRLDTARSKPGHGLGLNIVRAIAAAHNGTALVARGDGGLKIDIRIPCDNSGRACAPAPPHQLSAARSAALRPQKQAEQDHG